jgi:hypothetical protein
MPAVGRFIRRSLGGLVNRILRSRLEAVVEGALERNARDIGRRLQSDARDSSAELVREHMGRARGLADPEAVLDHACELVCSASPGLILEFGVWQGVTLNRLARTFPTRTVYGFDSFDGLPEDWRDGFPKGHFRLSAEPALEAGASLVKGLFADTLPVFLSRTEGRVLLAHIDCDLYSSTRTVLTHLGPRFDAGTIVVFNEYFNYPGWEAGEYRAFMEYATESGRPFDYVAYNRFGEQVAVRLA